MLSAVLAGGLASACSGGEDDSETIDVWIGFTDYRLDWAKERAAEFNEKHEDYTVEIRGFDAYEPLIQATEAAVEEGNPPAVVQYFEAATQEARDFTDANGDPLFVSVGEAIGDREEILGEPVVLDDIVKAPTDYYTVDGEFLSMPWNTSTTVFYSNKKMMDEAGIEKAPQTWDEIDAACDKIAKLKDGPENCITWPNHAWMLEQSVAQMGGLMADKDNGRSGRAEEVYVDSEEMMTYVNWWADLAEDGHYVYTDKQQDWEGVVNAFTSQNTAFLSTSSGDASRLVTDGKEAGFDVEVTPMPHNGDYENHGNLIGGATLYLTNGLSEKKSDNALAFMQYINNPENAADWHKTTGYIPITNSAVELLEEEGWFDENPHQRVANEQLDAGDGTPESTGVLLGEFVAIRDEMTQAMEDIISSGADPDERFAEAAEKAQQLLDDYNELHVG
ncbi:MAG: ABC transporter substrate-binding protein [Stackebrandtia sp.]